MKMGKTIYKVNETTLRIGEELIRSYGISAFEDGKELDRLDDVSPDRIFVEDMAAVFNRTGLSLVHFRDVVEDMLP